MTGRSVAAFSKPDGKIVEWKFNHPTASNWTTTNPYQIADNDAIVSITNRLAVEFKQTTQEQLAQICNNSKQIIKQSVFQSWLFFWFRKVKSILNKEIQRVRPI